MLKQTLQQKLLQKLSPQQIQLMKLLQVPTMSLEQRIKEELEVNPALEEGAEENQDDIYAEDNYEENTTEANEDEFNISDYIDAEETPAYKLSSRNNSDDEERKEIPITMGRSFQEHLTNQLGLLNLDEHRHKIAEHLIGSLDDDGYLRRPVEAIVDDLAFSRNIMTTEEEVLELLNLIQQEFDPPGVGARSLQECLALQLSRKLNGHSSVYNALAVIDKHFIEFSKKHFDKIRKKMDINEGEFKDAVDEILKLNPKPGNSFSETQRSIQHIVPDFLISNLDGELELTLNSKNAPDLRVNKTYANMLKAYSDSKEKLSRKQKQELMFVKQKLDSAKWFIDAIKQRQNTLLTTMEAIMDYQREYFLEGDETKLKPMILKDIADKVGLDISTISRVANSKYVQTPFGTFLLKFFFSESLQTQSGEEVSTREVKKILKDCIEAEDKKKPLTDEKLAKILKEKGYNIARRTVAKYREQLNIPVARLRKEA